MGYVRVRICGFGLGLDGTQGLADIWYGKVHGGRFAIVRSSFCLFVAILGQVSIHGSLERFEVLFCPLAVSCFSCLEKELRSMMMMFMR